MTEELSKADKKAYDAMMKRVRSSQAKHSFYPNFSFPTETTMVEMLNAARENGIKNIHFSACALGAKKAQWLAAHLDLVPGLESLNVDTNSIGLGGAAALFEKLSQTHIKKISAANNSLPEKAFSAVLKGIEKSNLTELCLSDNYLGNDFIHNLAAVLPRTSVKKLTLSHVQMTADSVGSLIDGAAACKMEELNISSNFIKEKGAGILVSKLPETSLTSINLENVPLEEKDAFLLMETLSRTKLKKMAFSVISRPSDALLKKYTETITAPACRLEESKLTSHLLSDRQKEEIKSAESVLTENVSFRRYIQTKTNRQKDTLVVDSGMPLEKAMWEGLLPQLLHQRQSENKLLTGEECRAKNEFGVPFIQSAAKAELLPLIFTAGNWGTLKEMQLAWNAVGADHKWQMDGKDRRPSYQKEKNDVGQKALNTILSVMKKAKQR